jgi:CTP synthase
MFCQVEPYQVVAVHNVSSTYHVPLLLEQQGLIKTIREILSLDSVTKSKYLIDRGQRTWTEWKNLTTQQDRLFDTVSIVLVGKYTNLHDSYLSVIKSLEHSAMRCGKKLNLIWVDASNLEDQAKTDDPAAFHKAWHELCTANGILVPGGFGNRGTEGMIQAAKWARINKTPYLGICLGMQIAVIEFARHVCDMPKASSVELNEQCEDPVVIFMPEVDKTKLGGTMRLGLRPTIFQEGSEWSRLRQLYGEKTTIHERHRHRYEVNPEYIDRLQTDGLHFVGKDDKGERMEIVELKDHPWFVGVQFHPEYLSRVLDPSKPYLGFVAAAAGCLKRVTEETVEREKERAKAETNGDGQLVNGLGGIRI